MEGSILFQSLCNAIVASALNPLDNRIPHPQQCDQKYSDTPVKSHIDSPGSGSQPGLDRDLHLAAAKKPGRLGRGSGRVLTRVKKAPVGSVHSMLGGSPAPAGFTQYRCHPSGILKCTPAHTTVPDCAVRVSKCRLGTVWWLLPPSNPKPSSCARSNGAERARKIDRQTRCISRTMSY